MWKQIALNGLLLILAMLVLSPVVQIGNEIHVLFDVDPLLLLITGESDPAVLSERHLDWYPNIGGFRIIVSAALACLVVYKAWKFDTSQPARGVTAAGRGVKRLRDRDCLDEEGTSAGAESAPEAAPDDAGVGEPQYHP